MHPSPDPEASGPSPAELAAALDEARVRGTFDLTSTYLPPTHTYLLAIPGGLLLGVGLICALAGTSQLGEDTSVAVTLLVLALLAAGAALACFLPALRWTRSVLGEMRQGVARVRVLEAEARSRGLLTPGFGGAPLWRRSLLPALGALTPFLAVAAFAAIIILS